ncbi:A/G-specific adenine glycosylase [Helicobacter jaachi]|uniref:Adenine DNA glycosylase n=1 Tax=Helicobacter jaachi TaxID=1677920 RepID=A0A4U8TEP8_9HELI|nr:A/G-specific adenine glycosylase [Helicobacter jaachi]TLD97838.1 A/G-specific adenine glycosylase [Helicobacter jaachi]
MENAQHKAQIIAPQWRTQILQWYDKHGRKHLPWRNLTGQSAAYGVYISEIMLQQTQVKRVLQSFYTPFMQAFPTLQALAQAPLESVLKMWEGLGYYTRARHLHKAAQTCVVKYNGALPCDYALLRELSGIGAYTAGAILCFGFGQSVAFVDGNIKRLLCRIFALQTPKDSELQLLANLLLDTESSFNYNQALLDIGALLCTPKSPACLLCPLQALCGGKHNPTLYPRKQKRILQNLDLHLALCTRAQSIALVKSEQALYHGLYNLPYMIESKRDSEILGHFKHHYTKYKITAFVYRAREDDIEPAQGLCFIPLSQLDSIPLSALCKKALTLANQKQSFNKIQYALK